MNNREYLRVPIPELAIYYNILPEGQEPPFFLGFGTRRQALGTRDVDVDDPALAKLAEALTRLEDKVDRILGYLEKQSQKRAAYAYQGQVKDISGGGLSFSTVTLHPVGAYLEMCLLPQLGDPRPIYAVGKICWIEPASDQSETGAHLVGAKFVEIDESDREAIIRLVFQLQRKEKEQQKSGEESVFRAASVKDSGFPCERRS